jgi:hypothetical protein
MVDFHLGDRVMWITERQPGIIIDLLDYEGENIGMIGVLLNTKEFRSLKARDCEIYNPPVPTSDLDQWIKDGNIGFPPSDCY